MAKAGAPPRKWYGPPGFQYPSFAWCTSGCPGPGGAEIAGGVVDTIIFSYSVTKEDIVLTLAPLASLKTDDEQMHIGKLSGVPTETEIGTVGESFALKSGDATRPAFRFVATSHTPQPPIRCLTPPPGNRFVNTQMYVRE
jgi:hypothetical protein